MLVKLENMVPDRSAAHDDAGGPGEGGIGWGCQRGSAATALKSTRSGSDADRRVEKGIKSVPTLRVCVAVEVVGDG